MTINWLEVVEKYRNDLLEDTKKLLQIPSILEECPEDLEAPFGKGIRESLDFMLEAGENDGFGTKNVNNVAGHISFGSGEEILGILCHLDVVPTGDNWIYPPFSATEADGKIYARGAIDDKGPTMSAYYALKMIKDLKLPLKKEVRIILGTDEETSWRGVTEYFKNEKMPDIAFAPDANFPLIYGEKGIINADITGKLNSNYINTFKAGERYNVVPDKASVTLKNLKAEVIEQYNHYLDANNYKGEGFIEDNNITLIAYGKNAHGMQPEKGLNAAFILVEFLDTVIEDKFIKFFKEYLTFDDRAKKFRVDYDGPVMGDLTNNVGIVDCKNNEFKLGLNMRYPIDWKYDESITSITNICSENDYKFEVTSNSTPHYVDPSDELVQTLHQAYIKYTDDVETKLITIGGGTYARSMKKAVAFGPLMPNRKDVVHQPNEYLIIDDFIKSIAIYAEAIYNLAK